MKIIYYPLVILAMVFRWPIYRNRGFSQRTNPPVMVGIFHGHHDDGTKASSLAAPAPVPAPAAAPVAAAPAPAQPTGTEEVTLKMRLRWWKSHRKSHEKSMHGSTVFQRVQRIRNAEWCMKNDSSGDRTGDVSKIFVGGLIGDIVSICFYDTILQDVCSVYKEQCSVWASKWVVYQWFTNWWTKSGRKSCTSW